MFFVCFVIRLNRNIPIKLKYLYIYCLLLRISSSRDLYVSYFYLRLLIDAHIILHFISEVYYSRVQLTNSSGFVLFIRNSNKIDITFIVYKNILEFIY